MDAILFEIQNWDASGFELESRSLFSRGVNPSRSRRCPHCNSPVYSRRHKLCGACAQPLPEGCLFTHDEVQSVRTMIEDERKRHRQWLRRFSH